MSRGVSETHIDHLLIGGGVAAASCAEALREQGAEGSIALLTRELEPPYHRPPCTKDLLRGESAREDAYVHDAAWYADHDIDLRMRTAVRGIDTDGRTVKLQGGDELTYGSALLATGSLVNRLRVDGSDLDGLHYVRALGNAESIRDDAEHAERVVVVGGSYIGCEVAASLTAAGQEGHGRDAGGGADGGAASAPPSGAGSAACWRGTGSSSAAASSWSGSRATAACSWWSPASGDELDADLVVLGTGVKPDVMLAKAAGLELGESGGVKCDARLQTSAPDLYAAGDICEYDSTVHGRRIRVEHEAVAEAQGAHVAAAMLGSAGPAHRGALLLDRPGRLGLAGVRRPRRRVGRGDRARLDGRRRVQRALPGRRPAGGLRLLGPRRRPGGGDEDHRRGRRASRPITRRWATPARRCA